MSIAKVDKEYLLKSPIGKYRASHSRKATVNSTFIHFTFFYSKKASHPTRFVNSALQFNGFKRVEALLCHVCNTLWRKKCYKCNTRCVTLVT